ncbi:hypothetical protein [Metamycoplasma equirhinis]|uniref:hypothetical protein n=1 Tax=Metamycoplasma equirhinis TaxID=92402 RepID=UPI003593A3FE
MNENLRLQTNLDKSFAPAWAGIFSIEIINFIDMKNINADMYMYHAINTIKGDNNATKSFNF